MTDPPNPPLAQQTWPSSDEELVHQPAPQRHGRDLGAVLVDLVPRQFAAARVDVDLRRAQPAGPLPQPAADPEEDDDGERQVRLEEALDVVEAAAHGADGDVELRRGGSC